MPLKDFIEEKKKEVEALKKDTPLPELKKKLKASKETRNFIKTFDKFSIIAEIKKASPSQGSIDENADIIDIAKQYEEGGASVISVLTDKKFFHGDINFISKIKNVTSLPILRKDFVIDKYQIYESRVYGADAILFIVGALTKEDLEKFMDLTHKLDMEALVEVHNEEELNKILELDKVKVIGINNRNLNTLETDLSVVENLMGKIPKDKVVISESGIETRKDVEKVRKLGVDGILTGTSLMRSRDKISTIKKLLA